MANVATPLTSSGVVGIADYGDLKQQIADWLNRTDLEEQIPEFVRLAESKIRNDLKVRTQEMISAGSLSTATTSVSAAWFTVPTQMNEARTVKVDDRELAYLTPQQYTKMERCEIGAPARYYTIKGEAFWILGGSAGEAYVLDYWEWFDYFTADDDTNWLLLNAPDVYLWAGCEAGALFLKDYEASADFGARYRTAVERVQRRENEMRYSGSALYVRPSTYE